MSKLECDAVPCDGRDIVRRDLSDSEPHHHGNFAITTPMMERDDNGICVKSNGCERDATCHRSPFHIICRCHPLRETMRIPPYGCHPKLSNLSHISLYPHRNEPVKDEYSFPVRLPEYCDYGRRLQTFQIKWPK